MTRVTMRIIYGLCLVLICSCDCAVGVSGIIIDKETKKVISNATVNLLDGLDIDKSNANGYFEVSYRAGFCKDPIITVKKEGYKPLQLEIKKTEEDIIYKVKSEKLWIDYDKPFYPDSTNKNTFIIGTWINKWSQDFCASDTLRIYLTKYDIKSEIETIKSNIRLKK